MGFSHAQGSLILHTGLTPILEARSANDCQIHLMDYSGPT